MKGLQIKVIRILQENPEVLATLQMPLVKQVL